MRRQSPTRTVTRSSVALADFHALAGHPGTPDDCADCAAQLERQRQAAAALRAHQRRTRQQVDWILGAGR
jgi:hypothetical protein